MRVATCNVGKLLCQNHFNVTQQKSISVFAVNIGILYSISVYKSEAIVKSQALHNKQVTEKLVMELSNIHTHRSLHFSQAS